jgi:sodium-dependent dicarboxylate transporter 2/3/5
MIAIFGAICLFLTPSGKERKEERFVLDWSDTKRMAWGILLLFGGGISLANQLEKAGMIAQMGALDVGYCGRGWLFVGTYHCACISVFE